MAKYSRTSSGRPASTGKSHSIAGAEEGSHRSAEKISVGVLAGTSVVRPKPWVHVEALLPELWFGDGVAAVSPCQSR